jgi:hypothetical protein
VLMSSCAEYSGYRAYPKSFRLSHKSAGKPPSSRQFKWVHACASMVLDPEADIWSKWQMSEPDANTCTKISSHGYKRMLHTQTTTKGFQLSTSFFVSKRNGLILKWITIGVAISTRCKIRRNSKRVHIKWWRKFGVVNQKFITPNLWPPKFPTFGSNSMT